MSKFIPQLNADYMALALRPRDKRRKPLSERKVSYVVDLQSRHRQIIRLHYEGMKNVDIAARLCITPENVSQVLNSQLAQEHLAMMHQASDTKVMLSATEMMETAAEAHKLLKATMLGEEEASIELRTKIATDYMARAGYAPIAKSQAAVVNGHFSMQELDELKARAAAARAEVGTSPENVIQIRPST